MRTTRRCLLSGMALMLAGVHAKDSTLRVVAAEKNAVCWVAARLLFEIYRQAGLPLQIEAVPASRASLLALSGQADGELIRIESYGQLYPQLLRVDPAFYCFSVIAYSMPERNVHVRNLDDLLRYSVGAQRGLAFVQVLTENHPAVTLARDSQAMFTMLRAGRLDLVLDASVSARQAMQNLGIKDLVASPELVRFDLYHYLHIRNKDVAPRIAAIIQRMKSSGELAQLTSRYEALVTLNDVERFTSDIPSTAP